MFNLEQIAPATFKVPIEGGMKVPGLIIATEELMKEIEIEKPLEQVKNVAHLPGIVNYSIAMPDIHWGYGFPIGGVAATSIEEGVVSPGGVGYDINCGVRLATCPISLQEISEDIKSQLIQKIFNLVPSGVGRELKGVRGLSLQDYQNIAEKGVAWSIEQGYGLPEDIEHIESHGFIEGASIDVVSELAKKRGSKQLGTIGSGNHFLEIGEIEHIFLSEIAEKWNIQKGHLYLLVHTGSRGFGHQICQDTLQKFLKGGFAEGLPDKQLVAAPIQSEPGKEYLQAMAMAANFAFNNRSRILQAIRKAFKEVLNIPEKDVRLLYDVCHNIAKFEEHEVNGKTEKLCVHRKGATRAFGPGAKELASIFQQTGQPVLVPGDMMRSSHIMAGMGNPLTWSSSCHGAGRAKSRHESMKDWKGTDLVTHMRKKGVLVLATSSRTIAEEMPDAYKNVDHVVEAVEKAGLAKKIARLKPSMVIKG
ncbi:MAG: RtcB family protein [Chlamydiota bacterium]|jgi:tRNA-splicing ligase RtcB